MTQLLREKDVERLLRGISTNHVETVRSAWRALLREPDVAVPLVEAKLASKAWQRRPIGPSSKYLGILLTLLHELDDAAFRSAITRLRSAPLHAYNRHTVDLIAKRYGDQVFGELAGGVPVYISDEVAQPELVFRYLKCWSKMPDLAISTVTRIDVVALKDEMDYLGQYLLYYDSIVLAWPNKNPRRLHRWLATMRAEMTFYHEVGHHFHQHTEGGQIKEQEREANQYSGLMFRKAHPVFVPMVRVLFAPVFWGMKIRKRIKRGGYATEA
ncbi:hypothetical protein [uncultured Shimia sp.]|uniref:hypothetical protein n=1 Tax=uncultured Shimia sp. TaxID=573152 RepID=UPI0025D8CFCB|nr:hypothetical protein [uncultured Shimia sp.]